MGYVTREYVAKHKRHEHLLKLGPKSFPNKAITRFPEVSWNEALYSAASCKSGLSVLSSSYDAEAVTGDRSVHVMITSWNYQEKCANDVLGKFGTFKHFGGQVSSSGSCGGVLANEELESAFLPLCGSGISCVGPGWFRAGPVLSRLIGHNSLASIEEGHTAVYSSTELGMWD